MTHESTSTPAPLPCTPDQTRCWRTHLFPLLLVFIILSIIYANSFQGTWIFDDSHNIVENPNVHITNLNWDSITTALSGVHGKSDFRPLAYLSFGLNHYVHGLDTWGYHLVNFTIHCLAALFLYLFIFQTLHLPRLREKYADRAGSIALLATLLWATHPIHVTAVTVIVQRMASMAAMFFIMAMFFYLMGRITPDMKRKVGWFALCVLAGILAFASKQNAVMLPVVLYIYDLLLIQGIDRQKLKQHLFYGAIPLLFLIVMAFILANPLSFLSGYAIREFTLMERLLTQPRILLFYLSLLLYPMTDRFTLIYEVQLSTSLFSPWTTLPAILFWTAWTGLGIFMARRYPLVAFCLLFFIINHLIESSIIPLELVYEHRNYLPSMTIYLLVSIGLLMFLHDFSQKHLIKALALVFIFITIAGQGYSVMQRNALFEHPLYVWDDNALKSPGLSRVYTNLGKTYDELGYHDMAKQFYQTAIDVDRFHRSDLRGIPFMNLGLYQLENNRPEIAVEFFGDALAHDPKNWKGQWGLASAWLALGEYESALDMTKKALVVNPNNAALLGMYSLLLYVHGEYVLAIKAAHDSLRFDHGPRVEHILGQIYTNQGHYELAAKNWQIYANAVPRDLEAQLALLHLAHLTGNDTVFRRTTINLLTLKKDRTWSELFQELDEKRNSGTLVFRSDPTKTLLLIQQGMEQIVNELREEMRGTVRTDE